ncbi:hypothetical protein M422DRAFT_270882 [Sphaerobolus stellatus SS14]|uniref:Uncharacterized protein n=1 Tax=Sphaerobolus stellatus (strain SS14) TaxID=990650 RepID=A0A0C9URK6_SPHS4|nr:hypothetical protein M422DRAFT_270882 [Sphaerobolus stellatus SS14]
MDATRISDNTTVMRKRVWKRSGVMVLNLNKLFRDEEYTCDPASHCSSYTELVEVPGYDGLFVMVMPFLRPYHNPEDLHAENIMMDASDLYPEGFHPIDISRSRDYKGKAKQHFTSSEKRPNYYINDLVSRSNITAFPQFMTSQSRVETSLPEF